MKSALPVEALGYDGDGCDENLLENHSDPRSMTRMQTAEIKRYLDFLEQELLPKLMVTYGVGIYRPFRLWCLEAPQEAMPLDFVETLDRFRGRKPKFSYRVYVSDDCPERIARARKFFRQCGGRFSPREWVDFQQTRPERSRLNLRRPQDVIACFRNLEQKDPTDRQQLLEDFGRVLFPGRVLMGPSLGLSRRTEAPFERVDRGIQQRIP